MFKEFRLFPDPILFEQPNFRDIGGILSEDGRKIRSGVLYRSGDFHQLSGEDIHTMESLGIRMVIDFRSDREVKKHPTPAISTVLTREHIAIVDSARDDALTMLMTNDAVGLEQLLVRDYRRMINEHTEDFRRFFQLLADTDHLPLVYHCAAGKDRTGLATYLLLRALGVSEENARQDYLLSNEYLKTTADRIIREVREAGNPNSEILRPLMEVRAEYLDAALDELGKQHGHIDLFLDRVLRVDRQLLQDKYLIP